MLKLRQFDAGAVLELPVRDLNDAAIDLDGTETATVTLEAPSGRIKTFAGAANAGTDVVSWTSAEEDFDEWGVWHVQARIVDSPLSLRSAVLPLEAERALDRGPIIIDLDVNRFFLRPQYFEGIVVPAELEESIQASQAQGYSEDMGIKILTQDSDQSGADWPSIGGDTTAVELPVAVVLAPGLIDFGRFEWDVAGSWEKTGAAAQTIDFELFQDGVSTGLVLSFPTTDVIDPAGVMIFTPRLRVLAGLAGARVYAVDGTLELRDDQGVGVLELKQSGNVTLDGTIDTQLYWTIAKSAANAGDEFFVRSILCVQFGVRQDS